MTDFPKPARWAEQTYFPNLGGGQPWESGVSPTKVDPPSDITNYGSTPDQPVIAAYDNWAKDKTAKALEFYRRQAIGRFGQIKLDVTRTGPALCYYPARDTWNRVGYNNTNNTLSVTDAGNVSDNAAVAGSNTPTWNQANQAVQIGTTNIAVFMTPASGASTKPLKVDMQDFPTVGFSDYSITSLSTGEGSGLYALPGTNTVIMGGNARFFRLQLGTWSVISPAGLTNTAVENDWWFYSDLAHPTTPNRLFAMNRCNKFLHSDDNGSTWSSVTANAVCNGTTESCSKPIFDRNTNKFIFTVSNVTTLTSTVYASTDGYTFTSQGTFSTMALGAIEFFGGVMYGLAIRSVGATNPVTRKQIEIVYSDDGGVTWRPTGCVLAHLVLTFTMTQDVWEQWVKWNKSATGLVACVFNFTDFITHMRAIQPMVQDFASSIP